MSSLDCLFCRIARGEVPARVVYQSQTLIAFLDIRPIRSGHVLVVPRAHFPFYDDLPPEVANEVMNVAQRLAPAIRVGFHVERVGLFFTGVDIPHAHAHVVPMVEPTDVTSRQYIAEETLTFRPAALAPPADLDAAAEVIRRALDSAGNGNAQPLLR